MIMNSQQVVSQSDAQVSLSDATSSVLGLLTVEHTSRHYGLEHLYTFHHLTFQEFLAAFHISGLEEQGQKDLLKSHSLVGGFNTPNRLFLLNAHHLHYTSS